MDGLTTSHLQLHAVCEGSTVRMEITVTLPLSHTPLRKSVGKPVRFIKEQLPLLALRLYLHMYWSSYEAHAEV